MSTLEARLETDVNSWVKAAVESSMGQLGVVGAMAMDEFLQKLKDVIQEIVTPSAISAGTVSPLMEQSIGSAFGVRSSTTVSGSIDETSSVPTAFGEGVVASID